MLTSGFKKDWTVFLGAGLLWCWFDKRDYGWTLSYYQAEPGLLLPCFITTLAVASLVAAIMSLRSIKARAILENGIFMGTAAAAAAAGSTISLVGSRSSVWGIAVGGASVQAVGFVLLFSAWLLRIVSDDAERTAIRAAGMFAISAVVDGLFALILHLLGGMSEYTMLLIAAILPLASVMLLHLSAPPDETPTALKDALDTPQSPMKGRALGRRTLVAIFLVCLSVGFVMGLGFSVSEPGGTIAITLYKLRLAAVLAVFLVLFFSSGKTAYGISRGGLLVMSLGCLCTLFLPSDYLIGLTDDLLLTLGFDCFFVFLCLAAARTSQTTGSARTAVLSSIQTCVYLSIAIGLVLSLEMSPAVYAATELGPFQIVASLISWLLVVGSAFIFDNGNGLWTSLRYSTADISRVYEAATIENAVDIVALKFGLSDRETEVARYLAMGNSYAAIGEKMYLSVNTIKTYVQSVYSKADVHSKQAFIDLLESYTHD